MVKSLLLFLILVSIGLIIANKTQPWTDEKFTIFGLKHYSYAEIIKGKLTEGCNSPLFYVIQKPFLDNKILPIFFTAISITLTFNYFLPNYYASFFSLACFLALKPIWQHYAEIRPYSLILLLSTVQCLLLIYRTNIKHLFLVNILMAFTHLECFMPILLSIFIEYRRGNIKYLWIMIFPIFILFYYFTASTYVVNKYPLPGYSNRFFMWAWPYGIILLTKYFNNVILPSTHRRYKI